MIITLIEQDCGINIEDINPDYIQPAATDVNQFQILEQHYDLVECICKEETRKELLADLKSKDALNPRWLYDKGVYKELWYIMYNCIQR